MSQEERTMKKESNLPPDGLKRPPPPPVPPSNREWVVSKHDWIIIPPTSLYDTLYKCSNCGIGHMESMDDPSSEKPKYGCSH